MVKEIMLKTLEKSLKESGFHGPSDPSSGLLEVRELISWENGEDITREMTLELVAKESKYSQKQLIDLANKIIDIYSRSAFSEEEVYIAPGKLLGSDEPFVFYMRGPTDRK